MYFRKKKNYAEIRKGPKVRGGRKKSVGNNQLRILLICRFLKKIPNRRYNVGTICKSSNIIVKTQLKSKIQKRINK
ncbi:hypothetical protein DIT68_05140 [Brumimicrobium oceani]|uniref:Uncharacterized protein n=1 Tax=Brumimicrobium oceani TaxID=2100725 RepID=A0A2U2XFU6_9FLAO|nr:hypothetical protein DIT68_05140 [Brumimicrobium oceani]